MDEHQESPGLDPQHGQPTSPPESLPSSPLSVLSKSPSLPSSPILTLDASKRYPSPTSSMPSGSQSPIKLESAPDSINVNTENVTDGPPPRKKRKLQEPKVRTTEYLDLSRIDTALDGDDSLKLERLLSALRKRKKIVVIAGAGISVSAGIPDFRSKRGLFATLPNEHKMKGSGKDLFDASVYKNDADTSRFHKMVCDLAQMVSTARPTPFHHMLASLAGEGRLLRLYTQNVDCIDTNMPPLSTNIPLNTKGPWPACIQLHGSIEKMVCSKCGHIDRFKSELFTGHKAPLCEKCEELDNVRTSYAGKRSHGIGRLRPRMVLYHEDHPDADAIGNVSSMDLKSRPDAVIVVGTSLKVPGVRRLVKELCHVTRGRRDGFTAWINVDPEPQHIDFKECWDLVIKGKCDDVAGLVSLPRWDEQDIEENAILSREDDAVRQRRLSRDKVEVQLPIVRNAIVNTTIPTTPAKPRKALPDTPRKHEPEKVLETKASLAEQVQGIPTPSASPKIPATVPTRRTGKTKQSKLSFVGKLAADSESEASLKAKKVKQKKPRQSKKSTAPSSTATLTQTFKAVKNPVDSQQRERKKVADSLASPDLSSQAGLSDNCELPPLRPTARKMSEPVMIKEELAVLDFTPLTDDPPSTPNLPVLQRTASSITNQQPSTPTLAGRSSSIDCMERHSASKTVGRPTSSPCIRVSTETFQGGIAAAGHFTPTHKRTRSADTISPGSIPKGMELLVD